jgi:ATP-dependent exoDNAse (exonuclease V) beta subunit
MSAPRRRTDVSERMDDLFADAPIAGNVGADSPATDDTPATGDAAAREQALDVTQSWLVQAPAGSGKTGLLIQRYLALLARVDTPERVVAMTFTRKAAAEMRERVLAALAEADQPTPAEASPHALRTRALAVAALEQDRRQGWQLVRHPARLRIGTIDAFTTALARAAPVATQLGALPRFVDDAGALYRAAARLALAQAAPADRAWATFLAWLDNDARAAVTQIADMLARRDQWLEHLVGRDPAALRTELERLLADHACAELARVRDLFPASLARELVAHARIALRHLDDADPEGARTALLRALAESDALPAAAAEALDAWCQLAHWLLTRDGAFTRGVTRHHGFPGKGNGLGADARVAQKEAFVACLEAASQVPGLAEALHGVRDLPPATFGEDAWNFVAAALAILPQAAAALQVTIQAHNESDFAEAMLRALDALGTGDAPGELLLALDARIDHLLVDEFQDTSGAQLELLARLMSGWQPGDGRTLFAVGDPMQSIYRFREAEVGIFLRAQAEKRIAGVPVGTLALTSNFRSRGPLVEWVNDVFAHVMPAAASAARGEVAFRAAEPRDLRPAEPPSLTLCSDREDEARRILAAIGDAQHAGAHSIAVLVRARAHVDALLPALRDAGIPYHAVELEPVQERLPTRDLVWLARALAQPADRLAWLALLRAPWCGLTLADLLVVAEARDRSILASLDDAATQAKLSPDGAWRVARLRAALAPVLASRGRASFALRVRAAWLALGGPGCAQSTLDLVGAERVLELLATAEHGGDLADFDAFVAATERLFATLPGEAADGIQVMTLHKAKGLEFDAVILPGLDRSTQGGQPPLLRWKMREANGQLALVIAPVHSRIGVTTEPDPVYRWLESLERTEEAAELGRLLYVGATRARERLHLFAVATAEQRDDDGPAQWRRPARGIALERLWDALAASLPPVPPNALPTVDEEDEAAEEADDTEGRRDAVPTAAPLVRLARDWNPPRPAAPLAAPGVKPVSEAATPVFDWAQAAAAAIGTVAHRLLAQLGRDGLASFDAARIERESGRIHAELAHAGVPATERDGAARRVALVMERTLADARGRWLYAPEHEDRRVEWALAGVDDGEIAHVALDLSFVAEGVRWIVDYKTGAHEGGDVDAFLDREVARYRPQLERYARLVRGLEPRPIRLALYYPLVEGGFRSFDFEG